MQEEEPRESEASTGKRDWRRTSFKRLDGSEDLAPDDWTLFDDNGRPIARIYHYGFGPNAGRWAWFILIAADGAPGNGGTGVVETCCEARETCERLLPPGTNEQLHALHDAK